MDRIKHPIPPFYNKDSKILILGSFPSVKSREEGFFYGHKQNRFWSVLAEIFECDIPKTVDEKKALLSANKVALWDVIGECDIKGSADSSISGEKVNDISIILQNANISAIFTNGRKAHELYTKHIQRHIGISAVYLPSTSPANAAWSQKKLINEWKSIHSYTLDDR